MPSKSIVNQFLESAGITPNGKQPYDIRIHDNSIYRKLLINPSLGAGEGYMEGLWDCDQLDEFFFRICRYHLDKKFNPKWLITLRSIVNTFFNLQTRLRSKRVAEKHYNLGNDLYREMLGETMAYTCAYWKDADNLDQAQYNKFDLICRKIGLKAGNRVLDLGCGWGSLAKYMAEKYRCEVVAVNISEEQVRYAKENSKHLPVQVFLCDYRDDHFYNPEKKPFDRVVSIGLCEHVGHKNYRHFMQIAHRNLKENGLFLLHTIGKNNSIAYVDPWINKYIFPHGILPSVKLLGNSIEDFFVLEDFHNFGADYDKTLMAWHRNFNHSWPKFKKDYDEKFFRLWNYYLLSCAGGFRARGMQLWQMVLSPKGILGGYESVR